MLGSLASRVMNSPELSGPRLAHGDTTYNSNICTNFRDERVLNAPTLPLFGLFKIKQAVVKVSRVMMK